MTALAVSRLRGLELLGDPDALCVDTFKDCAAPMRVWRPLGPFTVWDEAVLPVPGRPELRARSVESVWQGLKIVDGELDLAQLAGTPAKRPPDDQRGGGYRYDRSRFRLGDVELPIVDARLLIYLPLYLYLLEHVVPPDVHERISSWLAIGRTVAFYDWDANMDIDDSSQSFSHSSLLARWYDNELDELLARHHRLAADVGAAPLEFS
ncbi:DUF6939 family protein [Jatrophihabitans lederbergiae]|uniref:Uncharacterized protein n=1 Tax=Jatrophihabitans lederbergiae TaxID=3075547 RepID=A0ABU2JDV7_9ACTN|nr:hypothetical protein [Jatrophihabitans sp. DSM 44399]MDT0262448.1 hypothetical protein [Jatrophihabitans sp. DSM 44399]